jgi:hypothetical protein
MTAELNGGLAGIGEVLGLQRCPSFAKHGSHAPPPVRHMTAIHEPGLKEVRRFGARADPQSVLGSCSVAPYRRAPDFFSGNHFSTFCSRLSVWRLRRQVPS